LKISASEMGEVKDCNQFNASVGQGGGFKIYMFAQRFGRKSMIELMCLVSAHMPTLRQFNL
jgi:hypothetical protein